MGDRKIIIAVDGSKPAEKAFQWYLDNMKDPQRDMVILTHVPEYKVNMPLPGKACNVDAITKAMKEENDRVENMMGKFMQELKKHAVRAQTYVQMGSKPGEVIAKAAVEEGANAIVIGSRGLGKIRRTLMGSVSDYVAQHAPALCAVTIVRDS